jgi:ubiquinone/menaquinone biosynthesis C-methylase UbiE
VKSVYYEHSAKVPLSSKLSLRQRMKMYSVFEHELAPSAGMKVLDVGVTCDSEYAESNYFERLYPFKDKITCVGTEDASHLEKDYPGIKFIKVEAGRPLPFADNEFDIVFCSAVLEHTGGRSEQLAFVKELLRVGKKYFVTTPNRWFPVEMHTGLPFAHWLPKTIFRRLISGTKYGRWALESNLNLLSRAQFKALFTGERGARFKDITLFGFVSNLTAFGEKQGL